MLMYRKVNYSKVTSHVMQREMVPPEKLSMKLTYLKFLVLYFDFRSWSAGQTNLALSSLVSLIDTTLFLSAVMKLMVCDFAMLLLHVAWTTTRRYKRQLRWLPWPLSWNIYTILQTIQGYKQFYYNPSSSRSLEQAKNEKLMSTK